MAIPFVGSQYEDKIDAIRHADLQAELSSQPSLNGGFGNQQFSKTLIMLETLLANKCESAPSTRVWSKFEGPKKCTDAAA